MKSNLDDFKKNISVRSTIKKTVNLSEIKIVGEAAIEYSGVRLAVEKQAVSDFLKVLGLSQKLINKFDESVRQRLTQFVQNAFMAKGELKNVTLVFNPTSKTVVRILQETSVLSNETFFGLADQMINKYGLEIQNTSVQHDGSPVISLVAKHKRFDANKDHKEAFYPGLALWNDLEKGTFVESYMNRLTCTNGMITRDFTGGGPITFDGGSAQGAYNFFEQVNQLAARDFIPTNFQDQVKMATHTMASVGEVKFAADVIKDFGSNMTQEQISQFVPIEQIKWGFSKKRVDINTMNSQQLKNAVTNVSVWDVVNGMTDFASHNYGFNVSDEGALKVQVQANKLLAKSHYDTQNLVLVRLD